MLTNAYRAEKHSSNLIADKILEFIRRQTHGKTPFFLYYAPLEPHVAMQPLQEWIDRYPRGWDKRPTGEKTAICPIPVPGRPMPA